MKLYSYWRSSCSFRVRIVLNLKKISYEYVSVNLIKLGGQQHSPDFQNLNPTREVPFLNDGSVSLSQSIAIIEYLDKKYPDVPVFPKSFSERGLCLEICELINSGIQPLQNLKVLQYLETTLKVSAQQKSDWINHWIVLGLNSLEQRLSSHESRFCIGDSPTAADAFLIPQVYNALRFGLNVSDYKNIQRIYDHCLSEEAFFRAAPEQQPDAPQAAALA